MDFVFNRVTACSYLFLFLALFLNQSCLEQSDLKTSRLSDSSEIAPVLPASQLIFDQQPGSGLASSILSQQPRIIIADYLNNKITSGPDAWAKITLTLSSGSGSLIGTTSAYAVLGQIQFSDLKIDLTGVKKITATKDDLSLYGGTPSISAESSSFTITQGSGSQLVYSGPTSFDAGICTQISVATADQGLNPVTTSTNITIDLSGAGSGSFYSDSSCSTAISTTTINSGSSSSTLFYKNFSQENLNLIFVDQLSLYLSSYTTAYVKPAILKNIYTRDSFSSNGSIRCDLFEIGFLRCQTQYGSVFTKQFTNQKIIDLDLKPTNSSNANTICAILDDQSLYCKSNNSTTFTKINLVGSATQVIMGYDHRCALVNVTGSQVVKCWGNNNLRQLGDSTTTAKVNPTTINLSSLTGGSSITKLVLQNYWSQYNKTLAVLTDGRVIAWGGNLNPSVIPGISNVKDITMNASGRTYVALLDGTVQTFFLNQSGTSLTGITNLATISGFSDIQKVQTLLPYQNYVCGQNSAGYIYCSGQKASHYPSDSFIYNGSGVTAYTTSGPELVSIYPTSTFNASLQSLYGVSKLDPTVSVQIKIESNYLDWYNPALVTSLISKERILINYSPMHQTIFPYTCHKLTLTKNSGALNQNLQINLASSFNSSAFYSDSNCTNQITSKIIPAFYSTRDVFYYHNYTGSNPLNINITASSTEPGTASGYLALTAPGSAQSINNLFDLTQSHDICIPINLYARDSQFNLTYFSNTNTTHLDLILNNNSNSQIYSDANCSQIITSLDVPPNKPAQFYTQFFASTCGGSAFSASATGLVSGTIYIGEQCVP